MFSLLLFIKKNIAVPWSCVPSGLLVKVISKTVLSMQTPNRIKMKTSMSLHLTLVGKTLNIEVQVKGKDKLKDFAAILQ